MQPHLINKRCNNHPTHDLTSPEYAILVYVLVISGGYTNSEHAYLHSKVENNTSRRLKVMGCTIPNKTEKNSSRQSEVHTYHKFAGDNIPSAYTEETKWSHQ